MMWFVDLNLRPKLFVSFGVILVLLASVMAVAYGGITRVQHTQRTLYDEKLRSIAYLIQLQADLYRSRVLVLEMTLTQDRSQQRVLEEQVDERRHEIDSGLATLTELHSGDAPFLEKIAALKSALDAFRDVRLRVISLISSGQVEEARTLATGTQNERFEEIRALAASLANDEREAARVYIARADEAADRAIASFLAFGLLALAASVGMALLMNQVIAAPLRSLAHAAERIAAGDLTGTPAGTARKDEVGLLARAFTDMADGLREVNRKLKEGANVLASSSAEIVTAIAQVAAGAAETATAVSETTTTVEEVKQTAQVSSQKASVVSEGAQKAAMAAQAGRQSVEQAVEGMGRVREQMESIAQSVVQLSEQSQAIGEIIDTVNDLAEQSNLLAVNAAIEAARAGEQGKGFGVVAHEVKSLAEQSKQATAQVRSILGDIQRAMGAAVMATEQGSKAVELGVARTDEAGQSIGQLTEMISQAAHAATQIAASSQQQLAGMDQIALAMDNINQASAQNVTGTRQSEQAAKALHEVGQSMKALTDRYTT